jgi:hypothetical protein
LQFLCGFLPQATRAVQITLANTINLALTPLQARHLHASPRIVLSADACVQLLMMPWFMEMGARLLSWDHTGIVTSFLKVARASFCLH